MAKENQMLMQHYLADELTWQRHTEAERHRAGRRHQLAVHAAAWQARRGRHWTYRLVCRALELHV